MNKIVTSLWAGVVVSVSCFAAVRVGSRYSLLGLNGGFASTKFSSFSTKSQPPQFVANLNGYGCGDDSLHWRWDATKERIVVNLQLSAATLRYYYPSLVSYGQRLHTLCTNGTAPLKYPYDPKSGFHYSWTPFWAVKQLFDGEREDEFIKSWRDEINDHIYEYIWDTAWAQNLGVIYTVRVKKDGSVQSSLMSLDGSNHKKTATEGGDTGVIGDNKFPGNQMKIFFNGALSQMIADQLDTPEKFTDWLLGNASGVKSDFPAREALKRALVSDGSWARNWIKQPVWGNEKDEVSLLKAAIGNHFAQIREAAQNSEASGMVIRTVRWTEDVCDFLVEQQRSPHIYLNDDGYNRDGSGADASRSYTCTFGWQNSVPNLYLSDTSDIFYDRLTAHHDPGVGRNWWLGKEFRKSAIANDLDDIQKLINGTMEKGYITRNEYGSWSRFQEMLQHALWYHQRIKIQFAVMLLGTSTDKRYMVSVRWPSS